MDALFERVQTTLLVEPNRRVDPSCTEQTKGFDLEGREALVGVPEGEIPFSFARQRSRSPQQPAEYDHIFRGEGGGKASDPSVDSR